jgi:hypothetical protein
MQVDHQFVDARISAHSCFSDTAWVMDSASPASSLNARTAKWTRNSLLDPINASVAAPLIATAKAVVYLSVARPRPGRRALKPLTVAGLASRFMRLIEWMVAHDLRTFSDIGDAEVAAYIHYIRNYKGRRRLSNSARLIFHAVQPLRSLCAYAGDISDQPRWHPSTSSVRIPRRYQSRDDAKGVAIPTPMFVPFVSEAVRWLDELAPCIMRANEVVASAQSAATTMSLSRSQRARFINARLAEYGRSGNCTDALRPLLQDGNTRTLARLTVDLETAGGIVLQALVGVRVSELVTFASTSRHKKVLDDGRELVLLRGRVTKTSPMWTGHNDEWVAGFATPDNKVLLAFEVLVKLRFLSPRKELPFLLQNRTKSQRPLSDASWNDRLEKFNKRHCHLNWHFASHQFRRTFARFVAVGNNNGLFALKRHFKHVSVLMTDVYAGHDLELQSMIQDERAAHLSQLIESIVVSPNLAGKLGEHITAVRKRFPGRAGRNVSKELVATLMASKDVILLDQYYGLCVRLIDRAQCGGDPARIGISTCLPCENLWIGPRHEPFWQSRSDDNRSLLDAREGMLSDEARSELTAVIAEAEGVLMKLRGREE